MVAIVAIVAIAEVVIIVPVSNASEDEVDRGAEAALHHGSADAPRLGAPNHRSKPCRCDDLRFGTALSLGGARGGTRASGGSNGAGISGEGSIPRIDSINSIISMRRFSGISSLSSFSSFSSILVNCIGHVPEALQAEVVDEARGLRCSTGLVEGRRLGHRHGAQAQGEAVAAVVLADAERPRARLEPADPQRALRADPATAAARAAAFVGRAVHQDHLQRRRPARCRCGRPRRRGVGEEDSEATAGGGRRFDADPLVSLPALVFDAADLQGACVWVLA